MAFPYISLKYSNQLKNQLLFCKLARPIPGCGQGIWSNCNLPGNSISEWGSDGLLSVHGKGSRSDKLGFESLQLIF